MRCAKTSWGLAVLCGALGVLFAAGCPQAGTVPDGQGAAGGVLADGGSAGVRDGAGDSGGSADAGSVVDMPAPVADVPVATGPVKPFAPLLFVQGNGSEIGYDNGVFAFANPVGLSGNYARYEVSPTNYIPGTYGYPIWDEAPVALAVDRAGDLVAQTHDGILVFKDAQTATGNLEAAREINLSAYDRWNVPWHMILDRATDRVFVSNGDRILVFDDLWSMSSGDGLPDRVIESVDFGGGAGDLAPRHMALGANGALYGAHFSEVLVFNDAGNRNGRMLADRIIQVERNPGYPAGHSSVFVDAADRLYIVDALYDVIYVFEQAASRDGILTPDRKITIEAPAGWSRVDPEYLVVDAAGVGYVTDFGNDAIHIIEGIAGRSDAVRPERSIRNIGWETLYLWE